MMEGKNGEVRMLGEFWHICTFGGDDSWSFEVLQIVGEVEGSRILHWLKFLGGKRGSRFC